MEPPRWKIMTPSQYEWERQALDFIPCGLPNHDPYRAWANFEFQTPEGAIYEIDLLVLTKQGFWLVWIDCSRGFTPVRFVIVRYANSNKSVPDHRFSLVFATSHSAAEKDMHGRRKRPV